jgi:hypothetical protein
MSLKEFEQRAVLGSTLELAPALLETTAGHVASTVSDGTSAGIGGRAGGRVLATQTGAAGVVTEGCVSGTATADVVDGGSTAQITLELFVEAEDGALTAAVDVAGSTTAGDEGCWCTGVEASQRSRTSRSARIGDLGVLQADDVSASSTASVNRRATRMGYRRMRLNDAVI